jgi:hypothetical protein
LIEETAKVHGFSTDRRDEGGCAVTTRRERWEFRSRIRERTAPAAGDYVCIWVDVVMMATVKYGEKSGA